MMFGAVGGILSRNLATTTGMKAVIEPASKASPYWRVFLDMSAKSQFMQQEWSPDALEKEFLKETAGVAHGLFLVRVGNNLIATTNAQVETTGWQVDKKIVCLGGLYVKERFSEWGEKLIDHTISWGKENGATFFRVEVAKSVLHPNGHFSDETNHLQDLDDRRIFSRSIR